MAKRTKNPARDALNTSMADAAASYRGNVPLRSILFWGLIVVSVVFVVGVLASRLLIAQRENQLIEETAARVAVQAEGRARTLEAWSESLIQAGDTIAGAQLVRLYVAEMQGLRDASGPNDGGLSVALRAQKPYMQELVREFAGRLNATGAHLVGRDGSVLVSHGAVPEILASQPDLMRGVMSGASRGGMLPLRTQGAHVVADVVTPVLALTNDESKAPVTALLWVTVPVGEKLADLMNAKETDRPGERTALLQAMSETQVAVVGVNMLAVIDESLPDLMTEFDSGKAMSLSLVDNELTFATLRDVPGTPLYVLQEYKANNALALMNLYKPGIYTIVTLLVAVLGVLMLAFAIYMLAQRNKTRVKMLGQTMEALVRAVEARDPHLFGHHQRVARLAVKTANKMDLPVGERAALFYAAQLSAIGRLFVPADVLAKKGALTPKERSQLKEHVQQATDILAQIDFDLPIVPLIKQMYERTDGSGHPSGLKGDQISTMGRVLGACDAFVALTSERSHRKAFSAIKAADIMMDSGQFDPMIVKELRVGR